MRAANLFFYLIGIVSLVSCSPTAERETKAQKINWDDGPEGSKVAHAEIGDGVMQTVKRCWPGHKKWYDCLIASRLVESDIIMLDREYADRLEVVGSAVSGQYSCKNYMGITTESLSRRGPDIAGNSFGGITSGKPWSRSYIKKFANDNGLDNVRHFDCKKIMHFINASSIEAITTTDIRRSDLWD